MAKNNIKIALYQPDIPQNTAAIIRLCACFNTHLHIIEPAGFIINNEKFKRISMDYINNCEIKSYQNFEKFGGLPTSSGYGTNGTGDVKFTTTGAGAAGDAYQVIIRGIKKY